MNNSSLNHVFRLVWNEAAQAFVPVAEIARACGKRGRGQRYLSILAAASLAISGAHAADLPTNGTIVAGAGSISQTGSNMTITQSTSKMVADWQSFSIGQGSTVTFEQPSASSVALNRVLGSDVSVIQGALNANGRVFLVNPNGIMFSSTARVDVGSLVASTLDISTEDFMAGNYSFAGDSANAVINQGNITTTEGGVVAMIAARIINTGSISTPQGSTLMGAGSKVILDLGGPVKIEVEEALIDTYIEQGGAIRADGGLVYLTAKAANELTSSVINHTGITEARTLAAGPDGRIMLMGDMNSGQVQLAGTLDASAPDGGDGGFIETSAANVVINDVQVTTRAESGQTGEWLIDPNDYTVAAIGGDITGAQLSSNLGNTNVTIQSVGGANSSGNGDIFVNDAVTWSSGNTLTLNAVRNIEINAVIDASGGSGGRLALEYGQGSVAAGNTATYTINAPISLQNRGAVNGNNGITQTNFSTKQGSDGTVQNFTTISTAGALQTISTSLNARYALGADIDLNGISWTPISNFAGRFEGLGHSVSNLTHTGVSNLGLFGSSNANAVFSNLMLENFQITSTTTPNLNARAGALVGQASGGTFYNIGLKNISLSGGAATLDGYLGEGATVLGGLIGSAGTSAAVNISRVRGEDISVSGSRMLGGLIGNLGGSDYAHTISDVQLKDVSLVITGSMPGNTNSTGGLVGAFHSSANGLLTTSFVSNLSVTTKNNDPYLSNGGIGGVVGYFYGGGTLSQSYATGAIVANNYLGSINGFSAFGSVGGLVGRLFNGHIQNSYSFVDVTVNGNQGSLQGIGGLVGRTQGVTSIVDSYSAGLVSSGDLTGTSLNYIGGLIGTNATAGGLTLKGNYWGTETSTRMNAIGTTTIALAAGSTVPEGKTIAEMKTPATFSDWDAAVWGFADPGERVAGYGIGEAYPFLKNVSQDEGIVGDIITLFAGGYGGTHFGDRSAYTISNWTQLQNINYASDPRLLSKSYILSNSIDSTTAGYIDGGTGWTPIGTAANPFAGIFDGYGYVIDQLFINHPVGMSTDIGLFGYTDAGSNITNIGLTNVDITGQNNVGGLVGYNNGGAISNAYVTGDVHGTNNVGGLAGINRGSINKSYSTSTVYGVQDVGGFAGANLGAISNAYATGNVTGYTHVGGLVGHNAGDITNTYAAGSVSGTIDDAGLLGGLVGSYTSGQISNSLWNTDVLGTSAERGVGNLDADPAGIIGTSTAETKKFSTFDNAGWDIGVGTSEFPELSIGGAYIWTMAPESLNYNLTDISAIYKGTAYALSDLWSSETLFGASFSGWVLGTDYTFLDSNNNLVTSYTNAGNYSNLSVDILRNGYIKADNGNAAGALTITKAPLIITASNASKVYDGLAYSGGNGVSYSGFVASENANVLGGTLAYTGNSQGAKLAGSYTISPFGLSSNNYMLIYKDGILTIAQAPEVEAALNNAQGALSLSVSPSGNQQFSGQSGSLEVVDVEGVEQGALAMLSQQNTTGFMQMFVVDGGINLPDQASDIAEDNANRDENQSRRIRVIN
ncbi:MAG: filamentous hemagglutinin N-terminal domain-containing protein [Nitrincola lacisaponensis]|uniref:two-partner secretion domain-containing protein n=1 Tax=Nitrincola lacisaponensis TaxID=267850 RepID=UPI00391D2757